MADVAGPQQAPTVLLMHGGGQTRHAWQGTALALAGTGKAHAESLIAALRLAKDMACHNTGIVA